MNRWAQILWVGALVGVGVAVSRCGDDPSASPSTNTDAATIEIAPAPDTTPVVEAPATVRAGGPSARWTDRS